MLLDYLGPTNENYADGDRRCGRDRERVCGPKVQAQFDQCVSCMNWNGRGLVWFDRSGTVSGHTY